MNLFCGIVFAIINLVKTEHIINAGESTQDE
jgi:hypothetical protein